MSTGGSTQGARYEVDQASIEVILTDVDLLVDAVLDHYQAMDRETRVLLLRVTVYWPA